MLTGRKNSFVDRDMFMRYFGGGIGHSGNLIKATSADVRVEEDSATVEPDIADPGVGDADVDAALDREARQLFMGSGPNANLPGDGDDETEPDSDLDDEIVVDVDDDPYAQDDDEEVIDDLGPDDGEDSGEDDTGYGDY